MVDTEGFRVRVYRGAWERDKTDLAGVCSRYAQVRSKTRECAQLCNYLASTPFETYEALHAAQDPDNDGAVYFTSSSPGQTLRTLLVSTLHKPHNSSPSDPLEPPDLQQSKDNRPDLELIRNISVQVTRALSSLHSSLLCHGLLTPDDIHVETSCVSVSGYALPFIVGKQVLMKENAIRYTAPELFVLDPLSACLNSEADVKELMESDTFAFGTYRPAGDVWSLGMILAELAGLVLVGSKSDEKDMESWRGVAEWAWKNADTNTPVTLFDEMHSDCFVDPDLCDFISRCLYLNPKDRDSANKLLAHPFLATMMGDSDKTIQKRKNEKQKKRFPSATSYRALRSVENYFFQFNAGVAQELSSTLREKPCTLLLYEDISIDIELARVARLDQRPSTTPSSTPPSSPRHGPQTLTGTETNQQLKNQSKKTNPMPESLNTTATMIAAMLLSGSRSATNHTARSEGSIDEGDTTKKTTPSNEGLSPLPHLCGEHKLSTQLPFLHIVAKLQDLMFAKATQVSDQHDGKSKELRYWVRALAVAAKRTETFAGLSNSLRAVLWVTLLDIPIERGADKGSGKDPFCGGPLELLEPLRVKYELFRDLLVNEHQVDKQLEQDVPRCHQYHLLIRSQESRQALFRILKAWAVKNVSSVYWQGLDSVAACVFALFPGNESLAFTAFERVVANFMPGVFSSVDNANSKLLHSRLQVMEQLLSFHDPQLWHHLDMLGVKPDLYAIPWVLTMFAHVFPIHIVWQLWDYLLAEEPSKTGRSLLLFCVSVLIQLRDALLSLDDFGACIALLTRLPVSLPKLVSRSLLLTHHAQALTPNFVHLTWASKRQLAIQDVASVSYMCPILPVSEFALFRNFAVVVEVQAENETIELRDSVQVSVSDHAKGFRSIKTALASFSRWLVVIKWTRKEFLQPLLEFLVKEKHFPFLCLLEQQAVVQLATIAPECLVHPPQSLGEVREEGQEEEEFEL